jgi:hypothetical protein
MRLSVSAEFPVPNHPWISVIEGPLYRQLLPQRATDADLAAMIAEVERITSAMSSPFGWVTDISNVLKAPPVQRRMYAESEKRLAKWDALYCAGTGVCCRGSLTRGILTAVHWISPPAYPFKIFSHALEAERWARQQLINRGVPIRAQPSLRFDSEPAPSLAGTPTHQSWWSRRG